MQIKVGKINDQYTLYMYGGWVSKDVCNRVEKALTARCWNFKTIGGRVSQLGELGNEIRVVFSITARETDVQEFIDYLNTILSPIIPTAFTIITVNPYSLPQYGDNGGLTILAEIAKDTGCLMDAGAWMKPVTFHPEDNEQYNNVIELLKTFNMSFHNWCDQEQLYAKI